MLLHNQASSLLPHCKFLSLMMKVISCLPLSARLDVVQIRLILSIKEIILAFINPQQIVRLKIHYRETMFVFQYQISFHWKESTLSPLSIMLFQIVNSTLYFLSGRMRMKFQNQSHGCALLEQIKFVRFQL